MKSRRIQVQDFLSRLPLFNELASTELDNVATGTTEVFVPRGGMVFRHGDPCIGFHSVVYGQIKLSFVSPRGEEKVVRIIGPGDSFGEALMFMNSPYIVSAQALVDTLLLHVTKGVLFSELERDPALSRKMLAGLSKRLHSLMIDVEAYSLRSGTQRVISYLLGLSGEASEAGARVRLETGKKMIASRLNVTPEHFSRILHDLCSRELVQIHGRDIVILDIERLRAAALY